MAVKSIGRSSFWGMVAVSWLSILLLGGTWIGVMYYDFVHDSNRMREEHFEKVKELVRDEAEQSVALVRRFRKDKLEELWNKLRLRADHALLEMEALTESPRFKLPVELATKAVLDVISFENGGGGVYGVHGSTMLLLDPFPTPGGRDEFDRIAEQLGDHSLGEHQVGLSVAEGEDCTLLFTVVQGNGPYDRVVAGACLESAEDAIKREVVDRLETVRFGKDGYVFGGTWKGVSVVGPGKGRNMWNTLDGNGVYVVRELVAAAKRGGGFVEYVMPPVSGSRTTEKVSYAMPIRDWEWYIGVGQYIDDIEYAILQNREHLMHRVFYRAWLVAGCLGLLSVLAYYMSRRISRRMQQSVGSFTTVWKRASSYGAMVDSEMLHYKEFRDLADAANRMLESRRGIEEQLRESNEQFKALAENIPGIILQSEVKPHWPVRYISDEVRAVTGYPPSDFIGNRVRSFGSIIDPRDRAWVFEIISKSIKTGIPYSLEYRIDRKDGRNIWVFEKGKPRYDENGEAVTLDGVVFDVTDRKLAEDEHYQRIHYLETLDRIDKCLHSGTQESALSEVMEAIRQAFGADRSWLLTPCDPSARFFTVPIERSSADYPGAKARGVEVPVDDAVSNMFRVALTENGPVAFDPDSGLDIPNGLSSHFEVRSQLVKAVYPQEGPPWLMGLHQCTSPRVWSEDDKLLFKEVSRRVGDALSTQLMMQKLQNSEERFRTFSEQTMLGLCALQNGVVVFVNKAFCDIFEMSREDFPSMSLESLLQLVHPDDRTLMMKDSALEEGAEDVVTSSKWRAITRTGRLRWVQHHSRAITLNGRPAELISLTDITDMQRSNEELEQLIQERTSVLAAQAEQLEEANRRLLRLDELKSSFVTTVSHDLRTSLTSVLGYAKLVRRDLDQSLASGACVSEGDKPLDRIAANLEIMETEGKRLTLLIEEFMDLTSMEAGTATWHEADVDVEELLVQSVKQAAIRADAKPSLELKLDVRGPLPRVAMDAIRVKQVFGHLLENAIRYSEKGTILVSAEHTEGTAVVVSVSDQGKGIPESELEAIFEPFHQVETNDTLVDHVKGSGLGLSLSRGIIRHYGGTITVTSEPGKGSVFTVTLPEFLEA